MPRRVRKAVFPVAGLGSRFLPVTKASPKEMLPVVDKPLIQYAVEEAADAGITDMVFITGRNKRAIEDHFDKAYELESELSLKGKMEMLDLVQGVLPRGCRCIYIRQTEALGLGHAVLTARPVIGDEPFAILLADELIDGRPSATAQLAQHFVEKPDPAEAPSTLAVIGRYVLTPRVFDHLENTRPGAGGEIQLTDAIAALLSEETIYSMRLSGKRYDCGSKLGYLEATVELGLQHPETGKAFAEYLKRRGS
jgi:UTP--glucose-1-phosphate uridylyltransferase